MEKSGRQNGRQVKKSIMQERHIIRFAKSAIRRAGLHKRIRSTGAAFADAALAPIYRYKGRNIERFVLFVGYHRSGSSFIGAILNSHPEIVIANEAFRYAPDLKNAASIGKGRIVRRILDHDRLIRESTSYKRMGGYSLAVNTHWQGRYSRLRIIGNKSSDESTVCLYHWPGTLDSLRRQMGVPISAFFTYRNPYDMIAAKYLRTLRNERGNADIPLSFLDFNPTESEKPQIEQDFLSSNNEHFEISRKLAKVLPLFSEDEIFPVKHEDFIASPRENLRRACEFLGVECAEEYMEACAAIAYPSPHKTRVKVRWMPEQRAQVAELIRKYPWFEGYTYED